MSYPPSVGFALIDSITDNGQNLIRELEKIATDGLGNILAYLCHDNIVERPSKGATDNQ
jgi:hypothetical protein